MRTRGWKLEEAPDLSGKCALVTGANSGIGFEAAKALAARGARVVLACRDLKRGGAAADAIAKAAPEADVAVRHLDLADLASVRSFAAGFRAEVDALHLLINNAGVMALPYGETAQGFESQFGINHLGHFALTGLLQDRWAATPGARVVNVSSLAHRMGRPDFDRLQGEAGYERWTAYGRSKLANLLFTFELQRRLEAAHAPAIAVACHPGYAATNLQTAGPRASGAAWLEAFFRWNNLFFAQSARAGALPTVFAAVDPSVDGGAYIGPSGPFEMRGAPTRVASSGRARDAEAATRLWEVSEKATGVHFELEAEVGAS